MTRARNIKLNKPKLLLIALIRKNNRQQLTDSDKFSLAILRTNLSWK